MSLEPARELYIYYRVADANADEAARAVSTMQRTLRAAHPGLAARLLRRPDAAGGVRTWMETYSNPSAGVDAAIETAIADAARALSQWIDGDRHVEIFIDADRPTA